MILYIWVWSIYRKEIGVHWIPCTWKLYQFLVRMVGNVRNELEQSLKFSYNVWVCVRVCICVGERVVVFGAHCVSCRGIYFQLFWKRDAVKLAATTFVSASEAGHGLNRVAALQHTQWPISYGKFRNGKCDFRCRARSKISVKFPSFFFVCLFCSFPVLGLKGQRNLVDGKFLLLFITVRVVALSASGFWQRIPMISLIALDRIADFYCNFSGFLFREQAALCTIRDSGR